MNEQELREIENRNIAQIPMLLDGRNDIQSDVIRLIAEVRALTNALMLASQLAEFEAQQRARAEHRAELAAGERDSWRDRYWREARRHDLVGDQATDADSKRLEAELTK